MRVGKNIKKKTQNVADKIICQNTKCDKVGKEQPNTNFYNTNSNFLPKYPICKSCVQKNINIDDLHTVYRILKDMDIAFLYDVWINSVEKTPTNPFGSYIRMVNSLPQYKSLKWDNSIFAQDDSNVFSDKLVYSKEWMGSYTQSDIDYLNQYLKDLQNDFKIVTKSHKDYAKKISKASLAMDKAYEAMLNNEGSESKYKAIKEIFDSLSKSAQFAESERGLNDVSLGNFGVVFDKVEKKFWIPPHQPDEKDIYDELLEQFSNINKSL